MIRPSPGVAPTLRRVAAARVQSLQDSYLRNDPGATATLAELRRCDPAIVGSNPAVWATTLGNLPDVLTHYGDHQSDEPTSAERALHAVLVLLSQHLQSQATAVHVATEDRGSRLTFGHAVGRLARARAVDEELDSSTVRRLQQVALATTESGRLEHMQALIKLMRAESPAIALDYGQLAVDLWRLFDRYQDPTSVLVRWARALHARPEKTPDAPNEETK